MTAIPDAADFTGSTVTEAQFKSAMTDLRSYLVGLFGTAGTVATARETLRTLFYDNVNKSSAYTVTTGDEGLLIDCSGAPWTLTLPAAASAGDGFLIAARNGHASSDITIDGDGSETIDGSATITLGPKQSTILYCTGTKWFTVGHTKEVSAGSIGTTELADGAVTWAKLAAGIGNTQNASGSGPQSTTTSWADFVTDSITVDSGSSIVAIATIRWDQSTDGFNARLLIDGTAADTILSETIANDKFATLIGIKTGLTSGAKDVKIQVMKDSSSDASTAQTGDILCFEDKV